MSETINLALADNKKPYWIWGPLAFSLFYFMPVIFSYSHFTGVRLIGVIVVYIIFILCYRKAIYAQSEAALWPTLAIVSLCIAGTAVTPGTQALFGFAAYFFGFNFHFNKGIKGLLGILVAILVTAYSFSYLDPYFLAPAIIVSIGLFFLGQAERKDRIHQNKESKSQQQIEQLATIAERERIARDLHDLVGHSLSSIALNADLANKLIKASQHEQASQYINEVAALSRNTLSEIRHAVSGLKQTNLSGQLTKLAKQLKDHGFDTDINNQVTQIPAKMESHLILILTELVTNVLRHSQGDKVTITLDQDEKLSLTVRDNGEVPEFTRGNGLTGIKERCLQMGADIAISHDKGFCVELSVADK